MKTEPNIEDGSGAQRIEQDLPPSHSNPVANIPVTSGSERVVARTKRYHEFDALRGFAMVLGIVLHGLLSFIIIPIWPAQDIHQNHDGYSLFLHAIHGFRMPVFFLISGFFTAMMWRKRGAKGLVLHRAKRILLPLIIGTILVWPMMIALGYWGAVSREHRSSTVFGSADIWKAAKVGDVDAVRRMTDDGVDVDRRDTMRVSPLEWAAMYDHPDMITLLVEHGANVNGRNQHGSTPLHAAAFLGRINSTRKLVELGADASLENDRGDTALEAARVDMGIVYVLAGILQVPVDDAAVVPGKRETAVYLQGFEPGAAPNSKGKETGEATEAHVETGGGGAVDAVKRDGQDPNWGILLAVYLGATFFPLFHHLWFLYYLLWLVVMFLVAVSVRRWIPFRAPNWMIAAPGCLVWLVPLTLLPQLFMTQTFGVDTASGLLPWPPALLYYAVFFGFGALGFGRTEFEERAGRKWLVFFLLAVPTLWIGLHYFEVRENDSMAHIITSLCAVGYAWLMIFGMIGCFRRFFAGENRQVRYLSDSSYWLYLAHLPLIIGLQIWVSNWDVHHFLKFLLVSGLTFGVLILSYEYGVRYTFIGTLLNGKKTRSVGE